MATPAPFFKSTHDEPFAPTVTGGRCTFGGKSGMNKYESVFLPPHPPLLILFFSFSLFGIIWLRVIPVRRERGVTWSKSLILVSRERPY